MPHYIVLANFTDSGLRTIKAAPASGFRFEEAIKRVGGRLLDVHLTMGQHDLVVIAEAPDDEAFATALLSITKAGDMHTLTLKAFSRNEWKRIINNVI